ncbi:MAG: hypothetical protein B7Z72_11510, partial [Gemmatimonadetes bacterium 21-71-4]
GGTSGGFGLYVATPVVIPSLWTGAAPLPGLSYVGGAMAGTEGYQVTLGPFSVDDQMVSFRVDSAGDARDPTIADHPGDEHTVRVTLRSTPAPPTPAATADERPPGGPR